MSTQDNGGPAFPHKPERATPAGENMFLVTPGDEPGMTLRDYFAAKAMQGFATTPGASWYNGVNGMAEQSYEWADAMLKARAASPNTGEAQR